jgi:integrase
MRPSPLGNPHNPKPAAGQGDPSDAGNEWSLAEPALDSPYDDRQTVIALRELEARPVEYPPRKELIRQGKAFLADIDFDPDEAVPAEVDEMFREGVPVNTLDTYAYQWARFVHWTGQVGREHRPPTVGTMRYYIWSHWSAIYKTGRRAGQLRGRRNRPYAPNTVSTAIYAVSAVLQWLGEATPMKHPFVAKQLDGYSARWAGRGHQPDEAHALSPDEAVTLARACDQSTVQGLRLATMMRLQDDLGARASEIIGLNRANVTWLEGGEAPKARIWIARSKTDKRAKGRALIVEAVPDVDGDVDPALLLARWEDYLTSVGYTGEALFPDVNAAPPRADGKISGSIKGGRITARAYEKAHDRAVLNSGVDKDPRTGEKNRRVTTHSHRAGMITRARDLGMLAEEVAARTGHSKASNTIHKYWRGGTDIGDANAGTRIRLARKRAAAANPSEG